MSLRFFGTLALPKLDIRKFTAELQVEMDVQLKLAARAWLRAVLTRVPVWAGTSQGSLKPLGRVLNVAINPSPVPGAAKRRGYGTDFGVSIGESQGTFSFRREGTKFIFEAKTDVEHFVYNNDNDPRPYIRLTHQPIPWQAFQFGDEAFKKYNDENLKKRVPRVKDFITFSSKVI